ncbi:CAP domain-containing protein [Streptomyces verrucosisporus]|uniref:CAP domain-containing protein n=1 Tax=Streptomyces verrucosisporus TaxID=1695161 RepID=UPI0019D133AE|nr:CAP domain-containing protein [Streptomyces verrucosisporus]MBN3929882.1 CAP domain-containing protein [Streptomyces verrucosisporus]
MSKHRRTRRYRRISVAAIAVTALGVPTAALACVDRPTTAEDRSHSWEKRSYDDRERSWRNRRSEDRSPVSRSTSRPEAEKTRTPAAPPSASPAPSTSAPSSPAPDTSVPSTPSSSAPSTSAPSSPAPAGDAEARVVELVNSERAKAGCAPLKVNEKLTEAARTHSQDMADHRNMSHTGSDGSGPGDRIERAGYEWRTYGENVAHGYRTPESVMDGWMSSPGHKRNILNCSFEEIGVGLAQPGDYWTQTFGAAR